MMEATQSLMSEHRVIERVIAVLETAALDLQEDASMRPGFFVDAADFIMGFADGCHHKKEEGVLFPALAEYGLPADAGPVAVMLREHEQARRLTKGLREAAVRLAGEPAAREDVIRNALAYASLLRQHIQKEDHVLFAMAERVLPWERQQQVAEGFEHVEHEETGEGVHEKYLALAEALEREAAEHIKEA